jgi:large subunit ribosomal protein L15
MTFLSQLPKIGKKQKKRLGRGLGSGKGSKSGRGTTRHQKARESIPLHFEGGQGRMVKKFPLIRGKFRNKSRSPKPFLITLTDLEVYGDGETVDIKSLIQKNVVDSAAYKKGVKLLAGGSLLKKLIIKIPMSKSVAKLIRARLKNA